METILANVAFVLIPLFIFFIVRLANYSMVKHEKKCFLVAFLVGLVYAIYGTSGTGLVGNSNSSERLENVFSILIKNAAVGIVLGVLSVVIAKMINEALKNKAEKDKKRQLENSIKKDEWEFPCEEFYKLCIETEIPEPDESEFNNMKLKKAVQYILEKHGVPEKHWGKFLDKGATYYKKAVNDKNAEIEREKKAKKERESTIVMFTPDKEEKQLLDGIEFMRKAYGLEKKKAMLDNEIYGLKQKRNALFAEIEGKPTTLKWQKEKSWATWGGIAQGLAGPAAGIMTALQVEQQNEQIRQQNIAMLEAQSFIDSMRKEREKRYAGEIKAIEKKIMELEQKRDRLSLKIVLDSPKSDEIQSCISLKNPKFSKNESGVMTVFVNASCKIEQDKLPAPNLVADGTVHAKIYHKDKFVDDVFFVLPIDGIPTVGEGTKLCALCTKSLPIEAHYRIELGECSNLWIMEK